MMLNIDYTFLLVLGFRTKNVHCIILFVPENNINSIMFIFMIMFYQNDLLDVIYLFIFYSSKYVSRFQHFF